mgnify:CR=1 FL=1
MLDYKAIGRRIAFYRKRELYTQAILAEKLDISESYVSQVECGKVKISLYRLNQIAEILDINLALLVSDSSDINDNYGKSEFLEVINNWSPQQKSFLLNLLKCANEQFDSIDHFVFSHKANVKISQNTCT